MADANRISVIFQAVTGPLTKGLAKAGAALQSFGAKAQMAGIKFTALLTAPIALAAKAIGQATAIFQQNMTRSTAIMGELSDAMKQKMAQTAKDTARDVNKSSAEMAEGFFFLASAGLNAEQSIKALPAVSQFAVAGAFDLAKATSLAADAQSALGLKVQDATQNLANLTRVTDVLVKANTLANATTEQFSRALTTKAGTAIKIVNKEIEEGVAVLAAFADQGIKAENAGTALNIVFRDLKTKGLKNRQEWAKLGGVFDSTTGKMRHMADIVESLEGHIEGLSEEQSHAALKTLGFADKSLVFTQALIGMSGKIRDFEKNLKKAGGTVDTVAKRQLKNLADRFLIAKQRINEAMIELGTQLAPAFETVASLMDDVALKVKDLAEWFETLTEAERKNVIKWVAIAAAIGPALVAFGLLTSAIGFLTTAVSYLGTAMAFLVANPLTALVAIIGISLVATLSKGKSKMREFGAQGDTLGGQLNRLVTEFEMAVSAIAKFRKSKAVTKDLEKGLKQTAKLVHEQQSHVQGLRTEYDKLHAIIGLTAGLDRGPTPEESKRHSELRVELERQEAILNDLTGAWQRQNEKLQKSKEGTQGLTLEQLRMDALLASLAAGSKEWDKALTDNKREAAALAETVDACTIELKGMAREEAALKSAMARVAPYQDLLEVFDVGAKKALKWAAALANINKERKDIAPAPPAETQTVTTETKVKPVFGPDTLTALTEAQLAVQALQADLEATGEFTDLAFQTGAMEIWKGAVTAGIEELQGLGVSAEDVAENPAFNQITSNFATMKEGVNALSVELSESESAWKDWLKEGQKVSLHLTHTMMSAFDSISQGFGDVVARAIIDGEDFGQMMKEMWNNVAKQVISALVQIAAQWLITSILGQGASQAQHTTKIGHSTSEAAAAAFAAYAGIPFIGPALGAAAAVAATAGTVAASIAGYAAGTAAGVTQLATGGIVTRPTFAMIGEAGPEAVIPLTGRNGLSGRDQHINLYMDGQLVTETVLQNMPDEVRLNIGGAI